MKMLNPIVWHYWCDVNWWMERKYDLRFRNIMKSVEVNIERRNLFASYTSSNNKPPFRCTMLEWWNGVFCVCEFDCCWVSKCGWLVRSLVGWLIVCIAHSSTWLFRWCTTEVFVTSEFGRKLKGFNTDSKSIDSRLVMASTRQWQRWRCRKDFTKSFDWNAWK